MKNYYKPVLLLLFALAEHFAFAQQTFFKDSGQNRKFVTLKKRVIKPKKYRAVTIDIKEMKKFLDTVPSEEKLADRRLAPILSIINPDGKMATFRVWNSPVQEKAIAQGINEVSTFLGQGIDDPYATIRFDLGPGGFHAQIRTINGDYFIDPYALGEKKKYISYYRKDLKKERNTGPDIAEPSQPVRSKPEEPSK